MLIETDTSSPGETGRIGAALAKLLKPGDVISLTGDLGAGKTRFTQGLASGFGITERVTSPTFALLKQYEAGRLPLYHFDVYRFEKASELEDLGFEDYLYGEGVTVIEWGDKVSAYLPEDSLIIEFKRDMTDNEDNRRLSFIFKDVRWQGVVEAALR